MTQFLYFNVKKIIKLQKYKNYKYESSCFRASSYKKVMVFMIRTKVINDSADLVSIIRAFDSSIKKEVFMEISKDWVPTSIILDKFGEDGQNALEFFDKMKLAETKWTTPDEGMDGKPQKMYRSFYSLFNINISCPVNEISEIFNVSSLDSKQFKKLEESIFDFIGETGTFANKVSENFNISNTALKALVKRSNKFQYTGLKITRTQQGPEAI
jgi:predicted DNA-binding ArsR family transcriptional regulator